MSTTTERAVAGRFVPPRRGPRALSALISAVLHGLLLLALAATSVRIAPVRDFIPLVIRNPAPPPPPPPPGVGPPEGASVVPAPIQPAPVEEPKKVQPKPVPEKPKKIAAKHPPSVPPAEPSPIARAPAAAPEGGQAGSGVVGGVEGGVLGGKLGGKLGGRLGGTGDDVFTADQVAVPPKLVRSVVPDYPVIARARGLEGVVVLQGIIDRSGDVEGTGLTVLKSYPPFDDAAIKAFRQWRFTPGRNDDGEAVRVIVRQPIRFQLR